MLRVLALCLAICVLAPAAALAQYAPLDKAGPKLSLPRERLAGALACSRGLDGAARTPVLLVHGTGATREENWGASYEPALNTFGIPWCAVQLPQRGTGDIQTAAEYVVHAIRDMRRRAGRRIAIIGASQGGALPRWALRFWPDTRTMVDDVVALAPTNHGTRQARLVCPRCQPAQWQQMDGSRYIRALNSGTETFEGISYTNVFTRYDEVVQPPRSAELHTGEGRITNVQIQDICALDLSEHLALSAVNAVGFALAMDALANDGPADVARVAARGCAQPQIPGLSTTAYARIVLSFLTAKDVAASVSAEPPLRCYVTAECPPEASRRTRLRLSVSPRRAAVGRVVRLRVRVRARRGGRLRAVRRATVRAAGRRARTDRRGRATLRVRFVRPGPRPLTARKRGFRAGRTVVRVLERRR
jgi:hypothetical protein